MTQATFRTISPTLSGCQSTKRNHCRRLCRAAPPPIEAQAPEIAETSSELLNDRLVVAVDGAATAIKQIQKGIYRR